MTNFLSSLNPQQKLAAETTDGALLVLAGAGTGKTKVLTSRIANIISKKLCWPSQILAVTFTNKAAKEMMHRIEAIVGSDANGLWIGTFHSIAAKILRRHAEIVGLQQNFSIIDSDDQIRLIKQIAEEMNVDIKRFPPRMILGVIQSWKDRALLPEKITANEMGANGDLYLNIYKKYQKRLLILNAADFGDLLLHNLTIFLTKSDILAEYAARFHYILVDEYQDTNVAQYLWLRLLAQGHKNICCVGDDDQSIYGWRGAEVGNILRFEQDFAGAKIIRLEQNYRSKGNILDAASSVIANNKSRLGKTLWTDDEKGEDIKIRHVFDNYEEARVICDEIESRQRKGVRLTDMAILVRAGFLTRTFEECFMQHAVPYKVVGGLRFYERLEIRDILAYLRLVVQNDDSLAFERIFNTPKRGLGKASWDNLQKIALDREISIFKAALWAIDNNIFKGKTAASLKDLLDKVQRWGKLSENMPHADLAELILEESGYLKMWENEKTPEAAGRLENLKELIPAINEFENLGVFLEHVSLVSDVDDQVNHDMVNIMTLHAAKGLEFEHIFLPAWEEGVFPSSRSLSENALEGLEEERRLAYVALTRARKSLFITHAGSRRVFDSYQNNPPSRFISEMPQEICDKQGGIYRNKASAVSNISYEPKAAPIVQAHEPKAEYKGEEYRAGDRIIHATFGKGVITHVNAAGLSIIFESVGYRRIKPEFVRREKFA